MLSLLPALCFLGCSTSTTQSGGGSTTQQPTGIYSGYTQSYQVPWVGSPEFSNLTSTLKIHAKINGGTTASYTVDTGSVGVIVPASEVPNIPAGSPAGSITYTSSGLKLTGVWTTMPVTFPDAVNQSGVAAVPSSTVPVLAVTSGTCTGSGVNSGSCTGNIPHMLGIGFGRGTEVQQSPVYNVALNLTEMTVGTMRRGYMIQRDGLWLGLTGSNVSSNYVSQALTSAGTPAAGTHNDWVTPSGSFTLAGNTYMGVVLMDTGLLDMILEGSGLPSSGSVASGASMRVDIGTQHDYVFSVNDGGMATPTSVNYATYSSRAFVNTGLRALGHYDVLYDADGGLFGLWFVQ